MFVQIIDATVTDAEALRERWEAWQRDLQPTAQGFLGGTSGVAAGDHFLAVARFESEGAARANSDRPEQGDWWASVEPLLREVRFLDTDDVKVVGQPSDEAGFVQVIRGRATDRNRLAELSDEFIPRLREDRPEVLGWLEAWDGDRLTEVVYFSSEEEARKGEQAERPSEVMEKVQEWQSLLDDVTFLDLRDPWIH